MRGSVLLLVGFVILSGCGAYDRLYLCDRDEQCEDVDGAPGRCVERACAFAASDCAAGLRYDDSAGKGRGGRCIEEEAPAVPPFSPVALPGGAPDAQRLGPLFAFGAEVFAVGFDGQPFLLRAGAEAPVRLPLPLGEEAVVAATASAKLLALCTRDQLLVSTDRGMVFDRRDLPGAEALHHDGALLHLLKMGQVDSYTDEGIRVDRFLPAEGPVTALIGEGTTLLALVRGADEKSIVYLKKDGGAWQRSLLAEGPLSAGALGPADAWAATGPGLLLLSGAQQPEVPAEGPRQLVFAGADLWLRGDSWPTLLRRPAPKDPPFPVAASRSLREVRVDGEAVSYKSMLLSRAAERAELWVVSRFTVDRGLRDRLWRAPLP